MVTIKDIALALGVAPSTLTRALADSSRISPKTRKRVKQIASFSEKAANRLRTLNNPPSAIISAGAGLTEGMLNAVTSWKPVEWNAISLIGYSENNTFPWWCGSGLTTIDLPLHQITTDLCSHLLLQISTKVSMSVKSESHCYSSHLILRGSVKPYSVIDSV